MSAERQSVILKTMYMLYDAELLVKMPLKCDLLSEKLNNVAIYGAGNVGERFASFLKRRACKVDYFVDRKITCVSDGSISCYSPTEPLPMTQLLVVTAEYDYDDIAIMMANVLKCPVVALSDFLQEQLQAWSMKDEAIG